jgi:hypothetical protein
MAAQRVGPGAVPVRLNLLLLAPAQLDEVGDAVTQRG